MAKEQGSSNDEAEKEGTPLSPEEHRRRFPETAAYIERKRKEYEKKKEREGGEEEVEDEMTSEEVEKVIEEHFKVAAKPKGSVEPVSKEKVKPPGRFEKWDKDFKRKHPRTYGVAKDVLSGGLFGSLFLFFGLARASFSLLSFVGKKSHHTYDNFFYGIEKAAYDQMPWAKVLGLKEPSAPQVVIEQREEQKKKNGAGKKKK